MTDRQRHATERTARSFTILLDRAHAQLDRLNYPPAGPHPEWEIWRTVA